MLNLLPFMSCWWQPNVPTGIVHFPTTCGSTCAKVAEQVSLQLLEPRPDTITLLLIRKYREETTVGVSTWWFTHTTDTTWQPLAPR
jgi:hypothetical protein